MKIVSDVPQAFAQLVSARRPNSIALSGGPLAIECYRALRRAPYDWSAVDVFIGDERDVPVEHEGSNEGMIRRILFDEQSPRVLHSMVGLRAEGYDALLRESPPIAFNHMGLGPDGHTASLFPASPELDERDRMTIETASEHHPHPRITFSYPAIERCAFTVVTVSGAETRDAIQRIRDGEDLPGARIRGPEVLWLGDEAALAP